MQKSPDISDLEKGHIVMARCQGTVISETAMLVGSSRVTDVIIYVKR